MSAYWSTYEQRLAISRASVARERDSESLLRRWRSFASSRRTEGSSSTSLIFLSFIFDKTTDSCGIYSTKIGGGGVCKGKRIGQ